MRLYFCVFILLALIFTYTHGGIVLGQSLVSDEGLITSKQKTAAGIEYSGNSSIDRQRAALFAERVGQAKRTVPIFEYVGVISKTATIDASAELCKEFKGDESLGEITLRQWMEIFVGVLREDATYARLRIFCAEKAVASVRKKKDAVTIRWQWKKK